MSHNGNAGDDEDGEAAEIISRLGLVPHREGGHYRETWRDDPRDGTRGALTLIYYLLRRGETSAWHRVDATEVWNYYAGAALVLRMSRDGVETEEIRLGADMAGGEQPQAVVPPGAWQSAESTGPWSLTGCAVAPAFRLEGFEMASPDWKPGRKPGDPL